MSTSAAARRPLVKAYATFGCIDGAVPYVRTETVYFIAPNGAVFTSGERVFNDAFDPAGQAWTLWPSIPENAEFIGNYQAPAVIL